jgi:hypothetical protein
MTLGIGCCHDADSIRDHKRCESLFNGCYLGKRDDQLNCFISINEEKRDGWSEGRKDRGGLISLK